MTLRRKSLQLEDDQSAKPAWNSAPRQEASAKAAWKQAPGPTPQARGGKNDLLKKLARESGIAYRNGKLNLRGMKNQTKLVKTMERIAKMDRAGKVNARNVILPKNLRNLNVEGKDLSTRNGFDFRHSDTRGLKAANANISKSLFNNIDGADLRNTTAHGIHVRSMERARVAHLKAENITAPGLNAKGIRGRNATITGNLAAARFQHARVPNLKIGGNFKKSQWQHAYAPGLSVKKGYNLDLSEANFNDAKIQNAQFVGKNINMQGIKFQRAKLQGVRFGPNANLRNADMRGAEMDHRTRFDQGVDLRGADLRGVKGLNRAQGLHRVKVDHETKLDGNRLKGHALANFMAQSARFSRKDMAEIVKTEIKAAPTPAPSASAALGLTTTSGTSQNRTEQAMKATILDMQQKGAITPTTNIPAVSDAAKPAPNAAAAQNAKMDAYKKNLKRGWALEPEMTLDPRHIG